MTIISTIPNNESSTVAFGSDVVIEFDSTIDPLSIDDGSITISYIDPNVGIVDTNNIQQSGGVFLDDDFINAEKNIYVKGSISIIDNTKLVFTPDNLLSPLTKYDVYISDTVADDSQLELGTIYHMSFTTLREDLGSEETPLITELTTVIGTDVIYEGDEVVIDEFYVSDTYPAQDSFLISREATITFNKNIKLAVTIEDFVTVYSADLLSDFPEEEVSAVVTYVDNVITVAPEYENNKIYIIRIKADLLSVDEDELGGIYELSYLSIMNPYYISSKLVRMSAGTLLSKHSDLHIASVINYYSNDIDYYLRLYSMTTEMRNFIKQKYVLMYTLEALLLNNMNDGLHDSVSKKLADFSLSINSKNKVALYNRLMLSIRDWKAKYEITMTSMGDGSFVRNKQRFISDIGRLWPRGTNAPAINSTYYPADGMLNTLVYNGIMREIDV